MRGTTTIITCDVYKRPATFSIPRRLTLMATDLAVSNAPTNKFSLAFRFVRTVRNKEDKEREAHRSP